MRGPHRGSLVATATSIPRRIRRAAQRDFKGSTIEFSGRELVFGLDAPAPRARAMPRIADSVLETFAPRGARLEGHSYPMSPLIKLGAMSAKGARPVEAFRSRRRSASGRTQSLNRPSRDGLLTAPSGTTSLVDGLPLSSRERSFALRLSDGEVCPVAAIQHGVNECPNSGVVASPGWLRMTRMRPDSPRRTGAPCFLPISGPQSLLTRRQAYPARTDKTGIRCFEAPESAGRRAFEKDVAVLWPTKREIRR